MKMIIKNRTILPVVISLSLFISFPATLSSQESPSGAVRDISLDEALMLSMQNNLGLRMARTDSAIAREEVLYARAARTPFLSAGINYNYIGNPVLYRDFYSNDTLINYLNHQAGWNLMAGVPIYNGGRINKNIEKKQVNELIMNEVLKMTAAQVRLAVIQQFYTLYRLYREVEIIEANINSIEVRIRQLESRVANGQNLISDLKRTELQLSNYQIEVFTTRNNIAIIANYLCILTGIDPPLLLMPIEAVIEVPGDTMYYEACLAEAMINRYELKQSELSQQLSEIDLQITRSARLPVITGNALYNSQYPVPGTFPPQADILNYWAVGVGLSYEISSLYNINHRIRSNRLQIEKETIQTDNVRNMIDQELKMAYVKFIESKRNIESFRKNVDLARSNYNIVKSKYDNEFALIIDMIDAEIQLNDAQLSLNNAIIDSINQYYSLLYAMGKLN
ncbi:MAG: TolC family protein [Bacteroidales bacterium]|nr:TolC family protein [Bacteroidales bacterium]